MLQRKALYFLFSTIKYKIVGYASFALANAWQIYNVHITVYRAVQGADYTFLARHIKTRQIQSWI
jgi:hypothetical protein